jgi:hypothetical protein
MPSSVLYMAKSTPPFPLKSYTFHSFDLPFSPWNTTLNLPGSLITKSVARY